MRKLRHVPLFITLLCLLVMDYYIGRVLDGQTNTAAGMILGVVFAQVVLFAVWTALGPGSLFTRSIMGFCGTMLIALALVACIHRAGGGHDAWIFFAIVAAQWLVIQIPLQVARLFFGWRLAWPDEPDREVARREMQFGIGHLMVWTALVGVTFGIGRLLLPEDFSRASFDRQAVLVFWLVTIANSLLAWPIIWSTLSSRRWAAWVIVAGVCCLGLTFAEIVAFQTLMDVMGGAEVFWIVNLLQAGTSSVLLVAMRISGSRLNRNVAASG